MATVTTTTQTDPLGWPNTPGIARVQGGTLAGQLFTVVRTAADTLSLYRSTDAGGSWALLSSFTHTGLQEWSSLVVDRNGFAHVAYRIGTGTADTIWYRRGSLTANSWSAGLQTSLTDGNGGVIGSVWQGLDLAVVRHANGTYAIAVAGARTDGTARYGIMVMGVSIDAAARIYLNNGIIINNRMWYTTGTAPGRGGVTCEIEHNGDGFTASTPHLWVTWGRTQLRMVKLAWQGTYTGWSGPSNFQIIRSTIPTQDYANGRWDGTRWLMPVINPDDTTTVRVYQRNQANTATTTIDSPTHPTGIIRHMAVSYDNASKDPRVFAVGTSTAVLYFVDYDRATATWTAWATVSATAVLGTTGQEWNVRRGGSSGNARHDVLTAHTGAPNTIVHTAQSVSSTPNLAVWNTSAVPYFNGGAADVAVALVLDWDFSDPDPGQGQGSYALSRQIGAGALAYWRASDSTWQATEQQNASATTAVTLASGWGVATDLPYTYKVKVWDSANVPATGYSAALVVVPSAKVEPTITAPTAAQVLNTDSVTVTWTVAEQTARRVRLSTNPGGVVVYDSGFVATADLSLTIPYRLPNATGWTVEVTTRNLEGLNSTAQTRNFTVSYAPPPAPVSTLTPVPTSGWITVTPTSLPPVGVQPSIVTMDLYRRTNITPTLNANPDLAGNATGWAVTGGGTAGTLTYSTTQFRFGPGAARYVPPGAGGAATPQVEQVAYTDITAGSMYYASAWIRPDTGNKPIFVQLNWYTAANALISSTQAAVAAPVSAAWQFVEVMGDPAVVANAAKVRVGVGESGTPATADAFYADDIRLRVYDDRAGVRVAQAAGPADLVNDWGAESVVDHEYRWLATGSNGTSVYGSWQA